MGDLGQVEDTRGFRFLGNPLLIEQIEKNTEAQSWSNSASPMTMAVKAPTQCQGRGGSGRPPFQSGDCTLQTSPSAARYSIFTGSQKSRLAMGNWIFKWWWLIMLIKYYRLCFLPAHKSPACSIWDVEEAVSKPAGGQACWIFPKSVVRISKLGAPIELCSFGLPREREFRVISACTLMSHRKKGTCPNTSHSPEHFWSVLSRNWALPAAWMKSQLGDYPARKNETWSHRTSTSGMFQKIRPLGVYYTFFCLKSYWWFSTNCFHTMLPLYAEDKWIHNWKSLRANTMF